ncbi:MAG: ribonuclease III [Clostridiales bacterium]|jgi:ribonuclease-3|nr:ribonuclease III [Clostridiales bacterium]
MNTQNITGHSFKNPGILAVALTHSSFANENGGGDNERLEFLGDAVLELVITEYLFNTYSEMNEGEMTKFRAGVVCEATLARAARALGIPELLQLGRGEGLNGGRERDSILADAFEAVIGSVFSDGGFGEAKKFVISALKDEIEQMRGIFMTSDYKSQLQEYIQKAEPANLVYEIYNEEGPPHDRVFFALVRKAGRVIGEGVGRSKKEAEQAAAREGLLRLQKEV